MYSDPNKREHPNYRPHIEGQISYLVTSSRLLHHPPRISTMATHTSFLLLTTKLTRFYSKYTCSHRTCICLILLPSLGRVNPCRLARPLVLQRSTAIGRTSYGNPTSPHRSIHPSIVLVGNLPSLEL